MSGPLGVWPEMFFFSQSKLPNIHYLSEIGVPSVKHRRPEPGIQRHLEVNTRFAAKVNSLRSTSYSISSYRTGLGLDSPERRHWLYGTWGSVLAPCYGSAAAWGGKPDHWAQRPVLKQVPRSTEIVRTATKREHREIWPISLTHYVSYTYMIYNR